MATKKEKHARNLAKREAFLAKERAIGEKAIEVAARKRSIEQRKAWEKSHEKHYKFDNDCPVCAEVKNKQAVDRIAAAAAKAGVSKKDFGTVTDILSESPEFKDPNSVEKESVSA